MNPALARVQVEGGIAQGIGMALYEDVVYNKDGKNFSNSFMQYKIPTRLDVGTVRVEFESSYEPTGPFGAKSIGEIVINTPSPAIANAIYNASHVRLRRAANDGRKGLTWECKSFKKAEVLEAARKLSRRSRTKA